MLKQKLLRKRKQKSKDITYFQLVGKEINMAYFSVMSVIIAILLIFIIM